MGAALWWFLIHDPKVTVPDLTGLSRTTAEARLVEDGLVVRQALTEPSALLPGSVIRSDPPAGAKLTEGEGVVLYLAASEVSPPPSSQPAPTTAPSVDRGRPLPPPLPTRGDQPPPATASPSSVVPQPTTTPPAPLEPEPQPIGQPVHVERDLVLGRYNWVDLDNGAYSPGHGGDLYFGQDAGTLAFHLQPMSPGGAAEVGIAVRGHGTCATASTTTDRITLDPPLVGTVICVRTDEGRLSAVEITGTDDGPNGRNLHIAYTTWEA
ncbi:PASTA domain-containing protein [Actinosynnema sp. NPDC023658]|uniref:PASTA domain-containing protein n=1 Tax=Actinosynnema sp. NPDC023658 TaxID=3155465 RepID=UPI0033D264CD